MATKKSATTKLVDVWIRRIAKAAGSAKPGEFVLILNRKQFGSTGENWLGNRSFPSREDALKAAVRLGGRISS